MTTELTVLAWGAILGLVHIFAAGHVKTRQRPGNTGRPGTSARATRRCLRPSPWSAG